MEGETMLCLGAAPALQDDRAPAPVDCNESTNSDWNSRIRRRDIKGRTLVTHESDNQHLEPGRKLDFEMEDVQFQPLADVSETDDQDDFTSSESSEGEPDYIECGHCSKTFSTKKVLRRHVQQVHNSSKPYACDICNKRYKRLYDIKVHRQLHTNMKKITCDVCNFSTFYHSTFTDHSKRHSGKYKHYCDICGKGFLVKTWWAEHVNYHTGAKPFKCEVCNKAFMYSRYLNAHKKDMHSTLNGTRPINRCLFCGQLFSHKKSLKHHIKSHTGENKCLCDICGKELSSRDHLKIHRRIHTGEKPFMCSVCGKAFAKKCNLISHERIHTGERPYRCEHCGKCFNQLSALGIHRRLHTGQRPFQCVVCLKKFICQSTFTIHQKGSCVSASQ